MKKIAIAFSDIHFHDWKMYSNEHSRLHATELILKDISERAIKDNLPVLFTGDWYDNPKSLDNYLFSTSLKWYKKYFEDKGIKVFAISGNHDMSEKNTFNQRASTYLSGLSVFSTFNHIDFNANETKKFKVHGIPYLNGNVGFIDALKERRKNLAKNKPNILLIHTDLPGAVEPDGRVVGSSEFIPLKMKKFFKGFDLVLSGHIHKFQKLASNTYMLGAPYEQRTSDKNNIMGFHYIMEDLSLRFIACHYMPKFMEVEEGEKVPKDNNLYIIIPKKVKNTLKDTTINFSNKTHKKGLAKKYMKAKGIKDKSKLTALIKVLNKTEQ